jgi:hypothetical protein
MLDASHDILVWKTHCGMSQHKQFCRFDQKWPANRMYTFFWTVLLCIKQDNKRIIYNEIFTLIYIENLRQSGIVWRRYVTNSHRDQRRHLSPHFSWPKQITIIFFKLSRFVQQQFFFFALHFLRFGPTSLISVGHRAGYPIKTVENKTHIRYIYNIGLYGTLLNSTTTTIITRIYDKKIMQIQPGISWWVNTAANIATTGFTAYILDRNCI